MKDYYKVFKVNKNANLKEITESYNKLKNSLIEFTAHSFM
jgi:DnaJ-class molecular chaperone